MKFSSQAIGVIGAVLWIGACAGSSGQVLFFDDFEQFTNGADLSSTTYTPASGPLSASVLTSVQNGSPTIKATNSLGSIWAFFDNSVPANKNEYRALLSTEPSNPSLQVSWRMWIQATNSGPGMFFFSIPVHDPNPNVTYNPLLAFLDTGSIVALTNGPGQQTPIGNWGGLAGTRMTNVLILDYPNRSFSYSLNGNAPAVLPLGPYFTNLLSAIYFNGFERSAGSVGNRFALDDIKVELATPVETPSFQWAKRIASTANPENELAIGLALDGDANVYVTGWFDGTNDFGGITLTNLGGGGQDIFIAKYNSAGALQWAQRAGDNSANRDAGRGVGNDDAGNVYVTGGFFGAADFDGITLSGEPDQQQFFLAKYDRDGVVEWVEQSGDAWGVYGTGLAVDGAGNSYAVGYADNGQPIGFGSTTVMNTNDTGYSTFLVKYDSDGIAQWAQLIGGSDGTYSTSVKVDALGNVYVAGSFRSSVVVGTTNFNSTGAKDGFVAKFSSAGALLWARQMTGTSDGSGEAVSVDASGNVYVAGGFGGNAGDTISFGSSGTLTNVGSGIAGAGVGDAFLVKYDSVGAVQWARRAGGPNLDAFLGVSVDAQGNVFTGGGFGGIDLPAGFNSVVSKYDANGLLRWTKTSTGTNGSIIFAGPLVDDRGNCYLAGWFQTNAVFGNYPLNGNGYWNYFIAKLGFAPFSLGIMWRDSVPWLSVYGDVSNRFALEYVSALGASNSWRSFATNMITTNPFVLPDTNAAGNARRFYRGKLLP